MAQQEGFEPSSGFSRYTISNRARYDLFDTAASMRCGHDSMDYYISFSANVKPYFS